MRRTAIKRDPEQVRAWIDRSRQRAIDRSRAELIERPRAMGLGRRYQRKRKVVIPKSKRKRVLARSDGLCVCGCGQCAVQLHHVLPQQRFPELALNEANLVGVAVKCHDRHERAFKRLSRECLPWCSIALARTEPHYLAYLERTYPETVA